MSEYKVKKSCIVCDTDSACKHYCDHSGQVYVQCGSCNLIYVDDFAANEDMYAAYTGDFLKSFRRKLIAPFRKMRSISGFKHFSQRAHEIFSFIDNAFDKDEEKKFLDIGCNKGFLLVEGIKKDYDVYGVELVREVIQPFRNTFPQFKDQIFSDKFQDVARRFPDNYFGVISAIDVVEHFEDPLSDFCEVHRILKPGGIFVAQTPDVDCANAHEEGCDWGALKPLEHLHLFGRNNFVTFAKKAGFSKVDIYDAVEDGDGNFLAVLSK